MAELRMGHYDRQGRPITSEEAIAKRQTDYTIVACTELANGMEVCTRWMGLAFTAPGEAPLIFQTYVYSDGPLLGHGEQYATEAEALAGHERWVSLAGLAAVGHLHPEGSQVAAELVRVLRNWYGFVPVEVLDDAAVRAVRTVLDWQFDDWSAALGGPNTAS